MVPLSCNHCDYLWNYKGKSQYYTICPRCRYNVNVKKRLAKTECFEGDFK